VYLIVVNIIYLILFGIEQLLSARIL